MIGGHAQWVKGMVNEKIGQATGSEEWKASGRADMMEGTGAMKVSLPSTPKIKRLSYAMNGDEIRME